MTITRLAQLTAETRVLTDTVRLSASGTSLAPTISTTQAKTGTYSYRINANMGVGVPIFPSVNAVRLGYWLYLASSSVDEPVIYYASPGSNEVAVNVMSLHVFVNSSTGTLQLRRPLASGLYSTLAEVSIPSELGTTGTWFHVGITHKSDASSGFVSVYINSALVLNYVGDTRMARWTGSVLEYSTDIGRAIGAARCEAGSIGFADAYVDDMYADSIVGEADAPVPSRRFQMVLPTTAGVDSDWTPSAGLAYTNVDENPNDGDASYNKALAVDLRDTFVMGDISLPADHQIVAVIPAPYVKKLDSEIAHKLVVHAWDGSLYGESPELDLSMSYDVPAFGRLTTQPDGSDWNEADFNVMQFGYKSAGTF